MVTKLIHPKAKPGETRSQLNKRLVKEMKEKGKTYLRKHPKAFGRGIDPGTGIRYVDGKRISVTTPEEEAIKERVTLQEARKREEAARENLEKQREEAVERERLRIKNLRERLFRENAQRISRDLVKSETGEKVRHETLINRGTGERIFITTNLATGEIKTRTYERDKQRRVHQTGGMIEYKPTSAMKTEATKREQLIITFISKLDPRDIAGVGTFTKAVDVGGGMMQDFVIRYSKGEVTEATALGTPMPQSQRFKDRQKEIKEKELEKEKKAIKEKTLFDKGKEFLKKTTKRWEEETATTKGILRNAAQRGDIRKLADLQRLGGDRTPSQELELKRLTKETANNYELMAELIVKTPFITAFNMGIGSIELYNAYKENPEETIAAIMASGPAIAAGIQADFNRVASGDPLEIMTLGLEFWGIGKALGIVGKGLKVPIGIGRTLSPKYFGDIGRRLFIPPVALRGVVVKTAAGRSASKAIQSALKRPGVQKQIIDFNKKLKAGKVGVDKRLLMIKRKSAAVKRERKKAIIAFQEAVEYKVFLQKAKKLNTNKLDHWKLQWAKPSVKTQETLFGLEVLARNFGRIRALNYLGKKASVGKVLSKIQQKRFIKNTEERFIRDMRLTSEYKLLSRIAKENTQLFIKIPKIHLLAKKYSFIIINKFKTYKITKFLNSIWGKAVRQTLKPIRRIKRVIVKFKGRNKNEIRKRIVELQWFRRGSLNAAYLKAKNAQLTSKVRGKYESIGRVRELSPNEIKVISRYARVHGISKSQLLEGAFYRQKLKIKSDVPKYEADIKALKAELRGKKIKVKRIPEYYTFTRYGVVVSRTTPKGVTQAFAIEFNRIGRKISHIGFKTGVGEGKLSLIRVFKKARKVREKPLRVKVEDIYIAKNKFQSSEIGSGGLIKTLNTIETKKVFLNNKGLTKSQILVLKTQVKKALAEGRDPNLKRLLGNLYKDKSLTGKAAYTNTIRLQRSRDKVLIKILNKKNPLIKPKLYPKGQYLEIGYTKFKIPSRKLIEVGVKIPRPKKPRRKRPSEKTTELKKITVKKIKFPSTTLKIHAKKELSKIKVQKLEEAVKSIQTIVKPRVKVDVLPKIKTVDLIKNINILLPLVVSKNAQALKRAQSNLKAALNIQGTQQIGLIKTRQIKALQSESVKALQSIRVASPIKISPIIIPVVRRGVKIPRPKIPKKKKVPRITLKKPKRTRTLSKKAMVYSVVTRKAGKAVKLRLPPMILKDAKDVMAYKLDKDLVRTGKLVPAGMTKEVGIVPKTARGYFGKHSKKFRSFRIKKGKKITLTMAFIEKKKFIGDTVSEITALTKARLKRRKKPLKRKPKKIKTVKKRRITKKKTKSEIRKVTQ